MSASQVQAWPLERLVAMFGGVIRGKNPQKYNVNAQPCGEWKLHGPAAAGLCMSIYGLMSPRRRAAIVVVLRRWLAKPVKSIYRATCKYGHLYTRVVKDARTGRAVRRCGTCDRERDQRRWPKRSQLNKARLRVRIAQAEHRPCLCGCGTMVSTVSADGGKRAGWSKGHHRRRLNAGAG